MKKCSLLCWMIAATTICFSQNVGLGTSSPEALFHLRSNNWIKTILENNTGEPRGYIGTDNNGTVTFSSNAWWNGSTWVYPSSGPSMYMLMHQVNQQFEFRVRPDAGAQNTAMVIEVSGNVGVGTGSPQKMFSVAGAMVVDQNNLNNGTSSAILSFGSSSGEGIGSKRNSGTNQYGLDFYTSNSLRATISNAGNMGIGTITPGERLEVNGAIKIGNADNELPGTIRFNPGNNDFEGFDGTQWRSLTANGLFMAPVSDTGFNQQADDHFGFSVKMVDDYLFVGAPKADINGNSNQGMIAVYIKNKFTGKYERKQVVTAPDGAAGDQFGTSVDAVYYSSGFQGFAKTYYLLVGSPKKTVAGMSSRGMVYLFVKNVYTGLFELSTTGFSPVDGAANDQFGSVVVIEPDSHPIIFLASSPVKTVNGNGSQGRVYACKASTNSSTMYFENISQYYTLDAPESQPFGFFGYSIAHLPCYLINVENTSTGDCNEYYTLIGAPGANTGRGKIYSYNTNMFDTSFVPGDIAVNDNFGISITAAHKRIYVGASGKQVGANAAQGKVYILKDTLHIVNLGTTRRRFLQAGSIIAEDGNANDRFGYLLKADPNVSSQGKEKDGFLMVGSINRDELTTDVGSIYVYEKNPGEMNYTHLFRRKITDPAAQSQNFMGKVFDLLNNNFVIGIPEWDNPGRINSGKIIYGSIY